MCEPSHSIIQYPESPNDDDQNLTGQGDYSQSRLISGLGRWAKKISKWFHVSRMGLGHSETVGARSGVSTWHFHDVLSLYEAHWWNRQVVRDGGINADSAAFEAAKKYANAVSIGGLTQLRNFLGQSIISSNRPNSYLNRFREGFLNPTGRKELEKRLSSIFGHKLVGKAVCDLKNRSTVAKICCGFTRKRKLIVPEWADDASLWLPKLEIE